MILCLLAYLANIILMATGAYRNTPERKRAAWRVILVMPLSWAGLLALTLWDPFGMLNYFFR